MDSVGTQQKDTLQGWPGGEDAYVPHQGIWVRVFTLAPGCNCPLTQILGGSGESGGPELSFCLPSSAVGQFLPSRAFEKQWGFF